MLGSNPGLLRHRLIMRKQVASQIVIESLMQKCTIYVRGIQIANWDIPVYRRQREMCIFYRPTGTIYLPKDFFLYIVRVRGCV